MITISLTEKLWSGAIHEALKYFMSLVIYRNAAKLRIYSFLGMYSGVAGDQKTRIRWRWLSICKRLLNVLEQDSNKDKYYSVQICKASPVSNELNCKNLLVNTWIMFNCDDSSISLWQMPSCIPYGVQGHTSCQAQLSHADKILERKAYTVLKRLHDSYDNSILAQPGARPQPEPVR